MTIYQSLRLFGVRVRRGRCIVWPRAKNADGYGVVWVGDRLRMAHHVMYESFRGPVPRGREIDHKCFRTGCVNPYHLDAVTPRTNIRRAKKRRQRMAAVIRAKLPQWRASRGRRPAPVRV